MPLSYTIILIVFFLLLSAAYSLVKVVFLAIHSRKEFGELTKREERINAYVESSGFNECMSIGRIFSNIIIAVLGYIAAEPLISSFFSPTLALALYLLVTGLKCLFL